MRLISLVFVCLFGLMLYVHGQQLRSCRDDQLSYPHCFFGRISLVYSLFKQVHVKYIQLMYNTGYGIVLTVIFSILTGTCGVYTVDVQHRL